MAIPYYMYPSSRAGSADQIYLNRLSFPHNAHILSPAYAQGCPLRDS